MDWLSRCQFPLMLSRRRLARLQRWPRARSPWMLDSGGFTELSLHGRWTLTPRAYATLARRAAQEIGRLVSVAPQDWMCEPALLARTGLTVSEHQRRTVDNYRRLRDLAPELPWLPVLQGWTPDDYLRCAERYERAGVVLARAGVGTLCRRQQTEECGAILATLAAQLGVPLHAFGLKFYGLRRFGHLIDTGDTMAWSYNARRNGRLAGCQHQTCSNCVLYARAWRRRLLRTLAA